MRSILLGLLILAVTMPAFARGPVRVRGHITKKGTYVAPHYRSAPDRSRFNNWSTRGNVNPYTGKVGTRNPYGGAYTPHYYSPPRYRSPSYSYSRPSYSYSSPSYSARSYVSPGYSCRDCSPSESPARSSAEQRQHVEVLLASGVVKVPARTKSGYCLRTPHGYVGAGTLNYPAISGATPRCEEMDN